MHLPAETSSAIQLLLLGSLLEKGKFRGLAHVPKHPQHSSTAPFLLTCCISSQLTGSFLSSPPQRWGKAHHHRGQFWDLPVLRQEKASLSLSDSGDCEALFWLHGGLGVFLLLLLGFFLVGVLFGWFFLNFYYFLHNGGSCSLAHQ